MEAEDTNKISLKTILCFKDEINLSDKKYTLMLKQLGLKNFPSISTIRNERKFMDDSIEIFDNKLGVFVDAGNKINQILNKYYGLYQDQFKTDKFIRIKLSGDGTNVKHIHMLNFTFSLPDFKHGQAARGNFSLGVFEIINESYEELKLCFNELIPMLKNIKAFQIGNDTFSIKLYLAGDLKFLANMLGINQANSNFPCVWCKCP